jgi:hypothetical protein
MCAFSPRTAARHALADTVDGQTSAKGRAQEFAAAIAVKDEVASRPAAPKRRVDHRAGQPRIARRREAPR